MAHVQYEKNHPRPESQFLAVFPLFFAVGVTGPPFAAGKKSKFFPQMG
jgi:hypothetical protein